MFTVDRDVQLAAAGDLTAFEELYRRNRRRVYSLCLRMTRNVSEAEDLTQDVFVQLFRKLNSFRGESSFATWLHRLTVNEVLMHFRKSVVRRERTTDDGTLPTDALSATYRATPLSQLDRASLDEAIAQLSPGYRAVFILHDVEGYEHNEISQILGCAVGTSKSQLHKARMKLREALRPQKKHKQRRGQRGPSVSLVPSCAR